MSGPVNAVVPGPAVDAPLTEARARVIFREEVTRALLMKALVKPWWAHAETWGWIAGMALPVVMAVADSLVGASASLGAPWNALVPVVAMAVSGACAKGLQAGRDRAKVPARAAAAEMAERGIT